MPSEDERAFFDRIRDEPDDDGPRLIYADWLDENGQAERAEFIRLECALARLPEDDPHTPELGERQRQLSDAFEEQWTQELRQLGAQCIFHRGVIDNVSIDTGQFLESGAVLFELAPIRKVRFLNVGDRLADLIQSPLLRLVRELDLTNNPLGNRGPNFLARSKHLVRLDALDLGYTELGDKGLQVLAISPVFAPLRSLRINNNNHLGIPGMRALAESPHLTALTDLDVSDNDLSDAALRPLIDGPPGTRLTRLVLHDNRLGDAGVAALVASPAFARMAEREGRIDLRRVEMGPVGARALAESPALEMVEMLDLEGNSLLDAGLMALSASPYLRRLRELRLRETRVNDDGVRALARSELMSTLQLLDLTGNLIMEDSVQRLHEASRKYNWRGVLQLKVDDSQLRRPLIGPLGGQFRRPLP
jgi:uncharacterized protein (TIGR02996 family)